MRVNKETKYYDVDTKDLKTLHRFPPLPKKDCADTEDNILNANGILYVSRGTLNLPRKLKYPQFLRLDETNKKWIPLAPMIRRRHHSALVYADGKIYVFGKCSETGDDRFGEVYDISNNCWQLLPDTPLSITAPKQFSLATYRGKILLYGTSCKQLPEFHEPIDHTLLVFNPITNTWSNPLVTVSHPLISGLVVSEDKIYRAIFGICRCTVDGCQWHKMNVHELVLDIENGTASIGDRQDQTLSHRGIFGLNGEVFMFKGLQYLKTGITTDSNQIQAHLEQLKALVNLPKNHESYQPSFTTFTFDRLKWL